MSGFATIWVMSEVTIRKGKEVEYCRRMIGSPGNEQNPYEMKDWSILLAFVGATFWCIPRAEFIASCRHSHGYYARTRI